MHAQTTLTPAQLPDVLLNVAVVRPVFLWGAPGIGKSSLVRQFARSLGLDCVSLLGTQLAPEDLMGVPRIVDGRSQFCPPEQIARDTPYVLFLDELNAATPDVQKAFYSLILDRRIGTYELPEGSVVIGAGNRATDQALARPMASALVNRLVHVHLRACATDWLTWATNNGIHPWIVEYLTQGPDHLGRRRPRPRSRSPRRGLWPPTGRSPTTARRRLPEGRAARLRPRHDHQGRPGPGRRRRRTGTGCTTSPRRSGRGWSRTPPRDRRRGSSTVRYFAFRAKTLLVELAEISLMPRLVAARS